MLACTESAGSSTDRTLFAVPATPYLDAMLAASFPQGVATESAAVNSCSARLSFLLLSLTMKVQKRDDSLV